MNKDHRDQELDLTKPRLASTSKSGKGARIRCIGSIHSLLDEKGLKFYQTRCNTIIFHDTLPAYCIPKAIMMETGEIIYVKVYVSPRPPPKISYKENWMNE